MYSFDSNDLTSSGGGRDRLRDADGPMEWPWYDPNESAFHSEASPSVVEAPSFPSTSSLDMTLPKKRNYQPAAAGPSPSPAPQGRLEPLPTPGSPVGSSSESGYSSPPSFSALDALGQGTLQHIWTNALTAALAHTAGTPVKWGEAPSGSSFPQSEVEIERFLASVWDNDIPKSSEKGRECPEYMKKIEALKVVYDAKMAEASHIEELFSSQAAVACRQRSTESTGLETALLQAKVSSKFKSLRANLNCLTMQAIISLRAHYLQSSKKRKNLPQRAVRILSSWYSRHERHPYPSVAQRRELASQCALTVEQVSTWFSNRRCRTPRKGKGKAAAQGRKQ